MEEGDEPSVAAEEVPQAPKAAEPEAEREEEEEEEREEAAPPKGLVVK